MPTKKAQKVKKTPLKGPIQGSDIIIRCLEKLGVDTIFGYPGGASMELHQSLTTSKKIRMVLPRHEQAGAFAAAGYARATGKPGVCMATSGPGATNLITGIMDCKMDSIPIVAITGQVPTGVMGSDAFQETDIVGATLPCVKHSYLVKDIDDIPAILKEAFELAVSGRPGPVLVDFPKDIQQQFFEPDYSKRITRRAVKKIAEVKDNDIKKAVKMLLESEKPIFYTGGGIISAEASKELNKLVKKTEIPITTTLMGMGAYPETDPLCLKMLGMHGSIYSNIAINKADLVIALGVRFDDRVTGKLAEFCKNAKIIHVDIDAGELNKNKKADLAIEGDVKEFISKFTKAVKKPSINPWRKQIKEWKEEFKHRYETNDKSIAPQRVIEELAKLTRDEAIVSVGVGQHQMWTAQFYDFDHPRTWLCSSGLGTMGFGLPAAMGASVACPNRTVVNIDGDGSFLMNIQELQTLKVENIPVKTIVLNNEHLGMVAQWEDRFYESVRGHTYLGKANFEEIANSFGIKGATITKPSEVIPALKKMLAHKGPYVLDVKYPYDDHNRGHVIPMIPGGKTYLDSILHDGVSLKDYWTKKGILVD
jgi:acetolactate synthase-1/2/3 large subunit